MNKSEVLVLLDNFKANFLEAVDALRVAVESIEQLPAPEPEPEPDYEVTFKVTAEKALARFVYGYNNAGKPIFQIYPGDSITTGRKKYTKDANVRVFRVAIKADGGGMFYEILEPTGVSAKLYLRASDGTIIL